MFGKENKLLGCVVLICACTGLAQAAEPPPPQPIKLPYVYTDWQQFTKADGLPDDRRGAAFRCVIALARPGELMFTTSGRLDGRIVSAPHSWRARRAAS